MLDESIQELAARSLARIAAADTPEALEAARVEAVGRKGEVGEISKSTGQLSPDEGQSLARGAQTQLHAPQACRAANRSRTRRPEAGVRRYRPARAPRCRVGGCHFARARPAPRPPASDHAHPARTRGPLRLAGIRRAGRPRSRD